MLTVTEALKIPACAPYTEAQTAQLFERLERVPKLHKPAYSLHSNETADVRVIVRGVACYIRGGLQTAQKTVFPLRMASAVQ